MWPCRNKVPGHARVRRRSQRHGRAKYVRAPATAVRERACAAQVRRRQRADVVDAARRETVQLRDLRDADRGLVEHAVHAGRSGGVGRDLGDEEQRVGHGRNVLRRSRGELRQPPRGRVNDRVGEFERRYENGLDGKENTSARPVRAIDW